MIKKSFYFNYQNISKIWNKESLNQSAYKFTTDSRQVDLNSAFIAIKGKKFDAFKFIEPILDNISIVVFEKSLEKEKLVDGLARSHPKVCFISVDHCETYIQNLAYLHSEYLQSIEGFKLVAISGSNGKTTTKDMLFHLCHSVKPGEVVATLKNDNNHLGVPFTILRADPLIHKTLIVEYGSNHPGEIGLLCQLTHPNLGVTTNIGATHLEFFDGLEDVFKEESQIYNKIRLTNFDEGLFLINADDQYLSKLEKYENAKTFSVKAGADYHYQISESSVEINGTTLENNQLLGDYNFINLANAYLLALEIFPQHQEKLIEAARSFKPGSFRSEWIDWENKKVFFDAYNSNPTSLLVAARAFKSFLKGNTGKKALMLIGDMNELGVDAQKFHLESARELLKLNIKTIFIGRFSESFSKGFSGGDLRSFHSTDDFLSTGKDLLFDAELIFAKASRSLQFERIFDISKD